MGPIARRYGIWLATLLLFITGCASNDLGLMEESRGPVIMASVDVEREGAFPLEGAGVDGEIYVFLTRAGAVTEASFFLDDKDAESSPLSIDGNAPYDLFASDDGTPLPLDTEGLANGTHSITVLATLRSGAVVRTRAVFMVNNAKAGEQPGGDAPGDPGSPGSPTEPSDPSDPTSPGDPDEPPTPEEPSVPDPTAMPDFVVSPHGSDSNPGTMEKPFETVQRAVDLARPGDVIYLRGGVYSSTSQVRISRSGTADERITLASYPGELAILDGSRISKMQPVLKLIASYWDISGLEIRNGPWYGMLVEYAEHNVIARMDFHHNGDSGIHLTRGASYNLIVDCDSHDNYDPPTNGENADGFAIKHETAFGNTILRSRAYNNSDDGFDLLDSPPQRIDRSVAYENGIKADGSDYVDGNGNGFKLGIGAGLYRPGGGHLVTRSVAWGNKVWGFNSNNGTKPVTMLNNTGAFNGEYDFFFNKAEHILENNLSYGAKNWTSGEVEVSRNSWNMGMDEMPFLSTDPASADFLLLAAGSEPVDAGTYVGLDYTGSAPDLGAFELYETPDVVVGIPTVGEETLASASQH